MSADWIPVGDRLPKPWDDVLIALTTGKVVVGCYLGRSGNAWDWAETDDEADIEAAVTHWTAFPAAPASPTPTDSQSATTERPA